jgi:hypothetical protein
MRIKDFSLKFIDVMIGIVLGLGFQWWTSLHEPWQYAAFIFSYLDIVDYWIDYGPSLKKFPPKREIDVLLDVAIMFSLFLYIFTTQATILAFFGAFAFSRILDFFWLLSSKVEYRPTGSDKAFVDTWIAFDLIETILALGLCGAAMFFNSSPLFLLVAFIILRIILRIAASLRYKKVHFV